MQLKKYEQNVCPKPWTPVELKYKGNEFASFDVYGRTYSMEKSLLFSSVKSQGKEILSAPIRLVSSENGVESVWEDVMLFPMDENTDVSATVATAAKSSNFYINTSVSVEYDGCVKADIKISPRGHSVKEMFFGTDNPPSYNFDYFWLEIPIKKEVAKFYQQYNRTETIRPDGTVKPCDGLATGGEIETGTTKFPFVSQLFFNNGEVGFGFFTENEKGFEYDDPKNVIEVIDDGKEVVVRIHLLDHQPENWKHGPSWNYDMGNFFTINYTFGFMATPFKPYPANPYKEKAVHIDCWKRFDEKHDEYLAKEFVKDDGTKTGETGFDRLVRFGVNTLYIHEKWNSFQNSPWLSKTAADRLRFIVEECHKRGIKVVPYFGYEVSTISPVWSKYSEECTSTNAAGNHSLGWSRMPPQRCTKVCYASDFRFDFVDAVDKLLDRIPFDGIYLDGTNTPWACYNEKHGCGYIDNSGKRQPSYPYWGTREVMKMLYDVLEKHGGEINQHTSASYNLAALPFCHSIWDGEVAQFSFIHGKVTEMPEGIFCGQCNGRVFGTPTTMLCYENSDVDWTCEKSNAMSLLVGTLPKPNDMDIPLETASELWKIIDNFEIEGAEWQPYWFDNSEVISSNEKVKVSYFKNGNKILAFVSNIHQAEEKDVTLSVSGGKITQIRPKAEKVFENVTDKTDFKGYEGRIYIIEC